MIQSLEHELYDEYTAVEASEEQIANLTPDLAAIYFWILEQDHSVTVADVELAILAGDLKVSFEV